MTTVEIFLKGKWRSDGHVFITDRTGKIIVRCFVENKPKEAIRRLSDLFDALIEERDHPLPPPDEASLTLWTQEHAPL